jgi:hypothetical protein
MIDGIELISETTGRPLRANTVNTSRMRVDKDTGDLVWRDHLGVKQRLSGGAHQATVLIGGAAAATAANYGIFYVAPVKMQVTAIIERHEVAGSDGGAVTLMVKKVPSGTAPSAGTDLLTAGFNLKAVANTNVTGALSAVVATVTLAAGDALALVTTGTLTAVAGVSVSVAMKKVA